MSFVSLLLLAFIHLIGCSELWFRDCGSSDEYMKINGIDAQPYPIIYPGDFSLSTNVEIFKDIPKEDLKLLMSVDKLTPKQMRIPCIGNFGSCTYDYCEEYPKKTNVLLNLFGLGNCPFSKGTYNNKQDSITLPVLSDIFAKVLEGDFEANATFFNGKTNQMYGCIQSKFTVQLKK